MCGAPLSFGLVLRRWELDKWSEYSAALYSYSGHKKLCVDIFVGYWDKGLFLHYYIQVGIEYTYQVRDKTVFSIHVFIVHHIKITIHPP